MARIAGVDLPRDKKVEIGLTYIFGIGRELARRIVESTGVSADLRIKDLNDADVNRLLQAIEQRGNHDDFVGHIGGDDFVVITTPDRAESISAHAIENFDLLAPLFYDATTRTRGYIDAHDRQGRPATFPFVSLSIGIVSTALHPSSCW